MDRVNRIMVIDYSSPRDDKDAADLFEYFGIPGTPEENAERMKQTVMDFMKEPDCDDTATWFLKMFEDGRISPQEVLMFAVMGWSRPLIEMQRAKSGIGALLEALKNASED